MAATRRPGSWEFNMEAVRLATDGGKPLTHLARKLGIRPDMLRSCVSQYRWPHRHDEDLRRLRREHERLRQAQELPDKSSI